MVIDKLAEKKTELQTVQGKMKALADLCKRSETGFTDEQRAEFSQLKESHDVLLADIDRLRADADAIALAERLEIDEDNYDRDEVDGKRDRRQNGGFSKRQRADAFVGLFAGRYATDEQLELSRKVYAPQTMQRGEHGGMLLRTLLPEQPTRSQLLDPLFWKDQEEQRAQSVGTNAAGGHFVPDEVKREAEITMLDFNAVRQACRVIRTNNGVTLSFPTVSDTANSGAIISENVEMDEQDVTVGEVRTTPYAYTSKIVRVSWQLMSDSTTPMVGLLGRLLGERLGRAQGAHDTTGSGSSQPNGIVTGAGNSSVTTASNTAITAAELSNIRAAVDAAYQPRGAWMFDQAILGYIMAIDSNNAIMAGRVFGETSVWTQQYYINNFMATGASAKALLYGDMQQYVIHDVVDMEFIRLDERFAEFGQVGFVAWHRHDADILQSTAIKYATLAA